jgi:hypothetical protein
MYCGVNHFVVICLFICLSLGTVSYRQSDFVYFLIQQSPWVEGQRGGCVVAYPHHLGPCRQEVQDPVA